MSRIVGYVRVSTDRQADEGLGLDLQRKALRDWANATGHKLIKIVADEGVSGSSPDRPGLAEAIGMVRSKRADAVAVYRLDRLARDLVLQEQLLIEIRRVGGDLYSTSGGEASCLVNDDADPSRALIRQVLGAVSEYERSMIRLRLASGRQLKADRGGYAFGAPGYGKAAVGKELVAREDELPLVARVEALRAEGASLRTIAKTLTEEGFVPRRGKTWHPQVIARIAARTATVAA